MRAHARRHGKDIYKSLIAVIISGNTFFESEIDLKRERYLKPAQIFAIGFGLIILIGACLLSLPIANKGGRSINFIDALFTACSATCVTGLAVFDTGSQFTGFGQAVIITLIQLGGLGFMTFAVLISVAFGRRIGLKERINISEALGTGRLGGMVRLVQRILYGTLIMEALAAIILIIRFCFDMPFGKAVWFGIFHSISAFCNAGFDLLGSSLTGYSADFTINAVVIAMILLGGLGFVVWDDLLNCGLHFRKYKLHTKIVLTFSLILIVVPALLYLITERNGAFAGMEPGERLLAALFSAVTPRTAGFSTVMASEYSSGGTLLTEILMIIGASPGSTGGGIKITTFAVLVISIVSYTKGRDDMNFMERRVPGDVRQRALESALLYIFTLLAGIFAICLAETAPLGDIVFECISALSTVGLSMGITAELTVFSKLVLILLMFAGRVGSLTLFTAVAYLRNDAIIRYPEESVLIG